MALSAQQFNHACLIAERMGYFAADPGLARDVVLLRSGAALPAMGIRERVEHRLAVLMRGVDRRPMELFPLNGAMPETGMDLGVTASLEHLRLPIEYLAGHVGIYAASGSGKSVLLNVLVPSMLAAVRGGVLFEVSKGELYRLLMLQPRIGRALVVVGPEHLARLPVWYPPIASQPLRWATGIADMLLTLLDIESAPTHAYITRTVESLMEQYGSDQLLRSPDQWGLLVAALRNGEAPSSIVDPLMNRLESPMRWLMGHAPTGPWLDLTLFEDTCVIVDLSGYPPSIQDFVVIWIVGWLYQYRLGRGDLCSVPNLGIVLDEGWQLLRSSTRPLAVMHRMARGAGMTIISASQRGVAETVMANQACCFAGRLTLFKDRQAILRGVIGASAAQRAWLESDQSPGMFLFKSNRPPFQCPQLVRVHQWGARVPLPPAALVEEAQRRAWDLPTLSGKGPDIGGHAPTAPDEANKTQANEVAVSAGPEQPLVADDPLRECSLTPDQRVIAQWLVANPFLTVTQLYHQCGLPRRRAVAAVKALVANGLVTSHAVRGGRGRPPKYLEWMPSFRPHSPPSYLHRLVAHQCRVALEAADYQCREEVRVSPEIRVDLVATAAGGQQRWIEVQTLVERGADHVCKELPLLGELDAVWVVSHDHTVLAGIRQELVGLGLESHPQVRLLHITEVSDADPSAL